MPQKNERRGANESMSMPALTPMERVRYVYTDILLGIIQIGQQQFKEIAILIICIFYIQCVYTKQKGLSNNVNDKSKKHFRILIYI